MIERLTQATYIVYWITLVILFGGIFYVSYGLMSSRYKQWNNTYLNESNLKIATLLPIGWFFYTGTMYYYFDSFIQYNAVTLHGITTKFLMELLNLICTVFTTVLLTGIKKK